MSAAPFRPFRRVQVHDDASQQQHGAGTDDAPDVTAEDLERLDAQMPLSPEHATQRALWVLRLLLEAPRLSRRREPLDDDGVISELMLDEPFVMESSPALIRCWLAHRLEQLEQMALVPESIHQNTLWLASWLGLTDAQRKLLALAATVPVSRALAACMHPFARLSSGRAIALLAKVLRVPAADLRAGLAPQSPLSRAGLIVFKPGRDRHHSEWLQVADRFEDVLAARYEQPDELFSAIYPGASEPELGLDAFEHCSREVELLCALLRGASRERSRGVNVLLHGPPGSGKSQLVRAVARALGISLRQVPDVDPTGEVLKGEERLGSLAAMHALLQSGPPSLVLFDEIEDAFPWTVESGWLRQASGHDKSRTKPLVGGEPGPVHLGGQPHRSARRGVPASLLARHRAPGAAAPRPRGAARDVHGWPRSAARAAAQARRRHRADARRPGAGRARDPAGPARRRTDPRGRCRHGERRRTAERALGRGRVRAGPVRSPPAQPLRHEPGVRL